MEELAPTLMSIHKTGDKQSGAHGLAVAFDRQQITSPQNRAQLSMEASPTLNKDGQIFQWASGGGDDLKDTAQALRAGAEHSYQFVESADDPRRLTPLECERLQGFPDGWTAITGQAIRHSMQPDEIEYHRRHLVRVHGRDFSDEEVRSVLADTQRYKQLGNAVTVPVAEWLGRRISEVHHARS